MLFIMFHLIEYYSFQERSLGFNKQTELSVIYLNTI